MIAGNASATSRDPDSQAARAVSFVCQNFKSGSSQHDDIPVGPCPDGLRTQVSGKMMKKKDQVTLAFRVSDQRRLLFHLLRSSFLLAGMERISIRQIISLTCRIQTLRLQIMETVRKVILSN